MTKTSDDATDFDAAFAALLREDAPPPETTPPADDADADAEDTTGEGADKGAGEGEGAGEDAGEGDGTGAGEGDDEGAGEGDDEGQAADISDEELVRRFAALVRKGDAVESAPKPQDTAAPVEIYTADEKKLLDQYEQDFPEVARAEQLRRRQEYRELVSYVFAEIGKHVRPIAETVDMLATRTHLTELQSTVQDYDTIRDRVVEWVKTEPAFLQDGYRRVIESGTVDEVKALVERYRKATGASPAPTTPGKTQPTKDRELPSSARQAAAALAPVRSQRTAPVAGGLDTSNFEDAFKHFASK